MSSQQSQHLLKMDYFLPFTAKQWLHYLAISHQSQQLLEMADYLPFTVNNGFSTTSSFGFIGFPILLIHGSYLEACSQVGASEVFELLQGKAFCSVSWNTLFDCLSIYEDKFKQSIQSTGSFLPKFPEGDAKALVAYLIVLRKDTIALSEVRKKGMARWVE